jgi:hypothetical protein
MRCEHCGSMNVRMCYGEITCISCGWQPYESQDYTALIVEHEYLFPETTHKRQPDLPARKHIAHYLATAR